MGSPEKSELLEAEKYTLDTIPVGKYRAITPVALSVEGQQHSQVVVGVGEEFEVVASWSSEIVVEIVFSGIHFSIHKEAARSNPAFSIEKL